jgi:hypothetical protein
MYVEADISLGMYDSDVVAGGRFDNEAGGRFVDEATAMFIDGTMLRFREFTAVKFFFLVNVLETFNYCFGLWKFLFNGTEG